MLDGLELMSAFAHNVENYDDTDTKIPNLENYTGKIFIQLQTKYNIFFFLDLVDQILHDDDTNYDGFLSYTEYVIAKNKHSPDI